MANALRDHVWYIDTAGASAVTTDDVYVDAVRWVGATTNGHQAQITGVTVNAIMWESKAATATLGTDHESRVDFALRGGFKVAKLDSGVLYIYGRLSFTS